jgi:hypothetical protein
MSRERLTTRVAGETKAIDNDVFAQNNPEHTSNDPKIGEYAINSTFGEDVNTANPAADDHKRESTGHAPLIDKHAAAEAVASARVLEAKAVKCIIAAQRILPGAAEEMIEKQAAIFMHLPEEGLNATLSNQESLAKMISKQASETSEEAKAEGETVEQEEAEKKCNKEDEQKKEAAKKVMDDKKKKLEDLKKEAADLETELTAGKKDEKVVEEEDKTAAVKKDEKVVEEEDKTAAVKKDEKVVEEEDKTAAVKKDEKVVEEKEEVEASDGTLLDQIFGEVTASENKKGAAKLSGMVKKQASEQVSDLQGLWATDPDVSNMF